MKKYLITSAAALALCGLITSCSHDIDGLTPEESVAATYEKAFITAFGQPAPDQTWGFGPSVATTRAITVPGTNDTYNKFPSTTEINNYFPTEIPEDAKTDAELEALYKGTNVKDANGNDFIDEYGNKITMWDLYAIYLNLVGNTVNNIKVTSAGEYTLGQSWANPADRVYNLYINIGTGNNLTLKRNGAEHVNIYIMSGNVTIDQNYGECGGIISVAQGCTVNDQRTHIAHNDGVKIFNKGTYNATNTTPYWNGSENTSVFDIGNHCTFYNEGTFTCSSGISYSPADANNSYFINMGDNAVLTASSMTLNSTGNFYNTGTVTISGETNVTQANIFWVNAGHYTTGSMRFSAGNATFYNYCQLIVQGVCMFLDGQFNLMNNSYAQINQGLFNNFIVNMGDNAGINILNGSKWGRQGQGTFQGFRTTSDANNAYVRIAGQTYVPSHNGAAFHVQGANLTLAYQNIKFYNNQDSEIGQYSNYDNISYSDETTAEKLAGNQDGRITWDLHNVTKIITGEDFASTGFTLREGECAATWNGEEEPEGEVVRVIAEDLTASTGNDFDFNDVVFDVQLHPKFADKVLIKLRAAGGTLPLYIGDGNEAIEVHEKFGRDTGIMINTGGADKGYANCEDGLTVEGFALTNPLYGQEGANDVKQVAKAIKVRVMKKVNGTNVECELKAEQGEATAKLCVETDYQFTENGKTYYCLTERTKIQDFEQFKYRPANNTHSLYKGQDKFPLYVKGIFGDDWYRSDAEPLSNN